MDALKAAIAEKRKVLEEDPVLASRPTKYMRRGDIERLREEQERKAQEEKRQAELAAKQEAEARAAEARAKRERELRERQKVSVPSILPLCQVNHLNCGWRVGEIKVDVS